MDLTGRLHDVSIGRPIAFSRLADVLTARLIPMADSDSREGAVLVAVKVLRAGPESNLLEQERFRDRVAVWLPLWNSLSHPFVCPVLGVSYDQPFNMAFVLPYYANGNVISYLRRHPTADTYTLINEVAKGLLYLHTRTPPVIHQDIRGTNVLVDDAGHARLVDYGSVEFHKETAFPTPLTNLPYHTRSQAQELFVLDEDNGDIVDSPFTTQSDVYSFAMLGVEMITRDRPFNHRKLDATVILDVMRGLRPRRPTADTADAVALLLVDRLWLVFEACWMQNAAERPDMQTVCELLASA